MKPLTRRSFTAAGILAALGLTGCFKPSKNEVIDVYGPPDDPNNGNEDPNSYDPSKNDEDLVYGPPSDYDPSKNDIEEVYGPPYAGEDDPDEDDGDEYDPTKNVEPPVYGPPEGDVPG